MQESLVNIQPSFVSDDQSSELAQPCQRAFHNPSVLAQLLATLHSSPGNTRRYAPHSQGSSTSLKVVPFVGVQLGGAFPSASTDDLRLLDGSDCVHHISKSIAVMNVSCGADYGERNSFGVDHNMALRSRFSFIRRRWAGTIAPFLAVMLAESTAARDQSILPASPSLSSSTWWSFSHTPASCQSRSLRQQVIPLPQPISGGKYSQGKPVLRTNKIPVSAARFGTLGRPPFGFGGSGGNSGSITSQSSSLNMTLAIS